MLFRALTGALAAALWLAPGANAADPAVAAAVAKVRGVDSNGAGQVEAVRALTQVNKAPAAELTTILAGMDGANPLAQNWLRGAAEAVAQRQLASGGQLPLVELEQFLKNTSHAPRARRLAYELIVGVDPAAEARLIPGLLHDPSLELRRDAVAQALAAAAKISAKETAVQRYQEAFAAARDLDQIKAAADKLRDFGETPDVPAQMGFLVAWRLIGPFDNTAGKGWDVAYAPEKGIDLAAELEGQHGQVKWFEHTTADEFGVVELNKVLRKSEKEQFKGAIVYAYAELIVPAEREASIRWGCINSQKVWLNGELLGANQVDHAGMEVDQYQARGKLLKGKNTLLVKVCQNEQTEAWAQRWQFQLRVCDEVGTAILSQDRPVSKSAQILPPAGAIGAR